MWFSQEGPRVLKKTIKLKIPRLISVPESLLCQWPYRILFCTCWDPPCVCGCVTGTSVYFSEYWIACFQHSGVTSQDWSYLRVKPRERGKQGVRNDSFRDKRHSPFDCSVCLSWNALFLDLISSLTSERVCLNLPIVFIRRDPLPSWHIGVSENRIASQRSSLKLLSPEFLLGFSYIGMVDNISNILPSLEVGLG